MDNAPPYVIALYMRLSVEGSHAESMSIQNQRNTLRKYVDGMEDVRNVQMIEFTDDGYSGANFERPAVQRLLDMVQRGKIDCIVVKDFTRFGRSSLEVGYYMERVFPVFRIRFISVNDSFDSGNLKGDTGGINMALKYLVGEFYSRDLSAKVKSALYVRMRRGEYQSRICPYVYRKSADGRMEPDEETAPIVRLIFELASQGRNTQQISNALFERQIPTPGEYKVSRKQVMYDVSRTRRVWDNSTILRMLADERYTGTYVMGKRRSTEVGSHHVRMKDESEWFRIPDHHPAIVGRELYEKANTSIQRKRKRENETIHEYLLRKKVFCGYCHHALKRGGQKNRYFRCVHSGIHPSEPCFGMRISEGDLEGKVYNAIAMRMEKFTSDHPDTGEQLQSGVREQSEYEARIAEYKERKRELYERYAMHEITLDAYRADKAIMDRELDRLQSLCAIVCRETEKQRSLESERTEYRKLAENVRNTDTLTRPLVDALIERVYCFPDSHIEIVWKEQNSSKTQAG